MATPPPPDSAVATGTSPDADSARAARPEIPGVPLDTSESERLPILMEMVAALSRAEDASDVLREFAKGFSRLYGRQGYVSVSTRGLPPGQYKITRMLSGDVPEAIGDDDPWGNWSRMPAHEGGFIGRIIQTAYPQVLHHLELDDDPVVGDALAKFRSMMAIPLFDGGEPLNWSISFRKDPEGYSLQDLEETILRANLGGATVKNTMVTKQLREAHAAIRHEVEQIAAIQRALLPSEVPDVPGLNIGISYETFDQAGGDMYTIKPLRRVPGSREERDPSGPWGILIADVSGHGPAAAVVMAMMQAIIGTYPHEPTGPAEILEYCNQHLSAKRIQSRFVTAFAAIYDPATKKLTYARAGHNPPVWMRPSSTDGEWEMIRLEQVGGIPLGIADEVSYEEATIELASGQTIVYYTDGITEARGHGGGMFGVEGIEGSLTECTGWPECAIGHITENLRKHQEGVRPTDDQTLIVTRVE